MGDPQDISESGRTAHAVQDEKASLSPLEQKALDLAQLHLSSQLKISTSGDVLTRYLGNYKEIFEGATAYFRTTDVQAVALSIAAEWMLDNDYILLQALRQVKEDLPLSYYHELPKLLRSSEDQYSLARWLPRVFDIARVLIEHDNARLSIERIERFLDAYQEICPLKIGEVWAVPPMLRLGILEALAEALLRLESQPLENANIPHIIHLSGEITPDEIVANAITSLRLLGTQDWLEFFERISIVERILRRDPASVYAGMAFDTRDRYRKAVEAIASQSGRPEWGVAELAVETSGAILDDPPESLPGEKLDIQNQHKVAVEASPLSLQLPRQAHVGYYLVDEGRPAFERNCGAVLPASQRFSSFVLAHPTVIYLGSIGLVSALLLGVQLFAASLFGGGVLMLLLVLLLGLVPSLTVAVNLMNSLITRLVPPRILPRMDYTTGIPQEFTTLVAIPALISSEPDVDFLLQQIELHYLRNLGENLYFALLTDFADSSEKEMPEDALLVEKAADGIRELNQRYPRHGSDPFLLLHRERRWNDMENAWMGWERKRGKLHELNRLILRQGETSFAYQAGNVGVLTAIRYVITVDADTILPREAASNLVAALSHPLNRPEFDPGTGRMRSGYTILQPRTEVVWTRPYQSIFTRIYAGDRGIDLYTLAVSDVYQDLFGEGIYTGKGIYDVAAFEASLEGRVPENALLSHDLFEGIHGRVGLLTDVVIIEDYPPNYLVEIHRSHRWVRGDWQLLPWLLPRVPSESGSRIRNRMSWIDRWKILDNLRRSLLAPALLVYFMAGWILFPGSPFFWTGAGILVMSIPTITALVGGAWQLLSGSTLLEAGLPIWQNLIRWVMALIFLPYEALVDLDAILTTLIRLFIEKRRLLQWTTAAEAARNVGIFLSPQVTWQQMIAAFLFGLVLGAVLAVFVPSALWAAWPLLVVWVLSPQIAYLISRPSGLRAEALGEEECRRLRELAVQTWLFFEQFAGPEDHWLPPDHFQEAPRGIVAHRTSPTNIGLGFISTLAALDMGYIELVDFAARLRLMFDSLADLDLYRGHFLNWYDTQTLRPLTPRYISTVDSGNLAAALVTLQEGCLSTLEQPLLRSQSWEGLADVVGLIASLVQSWEYQPEASHTWDHSAVLQAYLEGFRAYLLSLMGQTDCWSGALRELAGKAAQTGDSSGESTYNLDELYRRLMEFVEDNVETIAPEQVNRLRLFVQQLRRQKEGFDRQVDLLAPWLRTIFNPPEAVRDLKISPNGHILWDELNSISPTSVCLKEVDQLIERIHQLSSEIAGSLKEQKLGDEPLKEAQNWLSQLTAQVESGVLRAKVIEIGLGELARESERILEKMDFSFLFDPQRQVFHLGYNLESDRLDSNHYDLLASEARIASYLAIAKGDVPQAHWLHLGRPITQAGGSLCLVSWSATMFEYLLPALLMRTYPGTLLDTSLRAAINTQIDYAHERMVPWGISEAGFYQFDNNQNYQYRAFGIPALAFKRGLEDDLVITSHASFMALPFRPKSVYDNYQRLVKLGMLGTYGLYESVDFTKERVPPGEKFAIIRSYMAHHQGMLFLGLVNYLKDNVMISRFHNNPLVQSMELLLQEQIPARAPLEQPHPVGERAFRLPPRQIDNRPWRVRLRTPQPRPHLLSNGRYSVLLTNAGSGYSRYREIDLTRWRPDTTLDGWGSWIYIQDVDATDNGFWSATYQPGGKAPDSMEVNYYPSKAEFRRKDGDIAVRMEVTVPPEDDLEVRRITITNYADRPRRLRLSSYAEVSLAPRSSDERHPAFNKLFIESRLLPELQALLFRRRPRDASEQPVFMAHTVLTEKGKAEGFGFETDRNAFLGRGHNPRQPQALLECGAQPVEGATGSTLDPVASVSALVEIPAHGRFQLTFLTLAGESEKKLISSLQRYRRWYTIERLFDQARTQADLEMRELGVTGIDIHAFQRLLSVLIYPHKALRAPPDVLKGNTEGQTGLWGFSISGDYPILLVILRGGDDLRLAQEALRAHTYWRNRQIPIDLVLLNEQGVNYGQELSNQLRRLLLSLKMDTWLNQRGGIFILYKDQMSDQDRTLLYAAARAILDGSQGSLAEQVRKLRAAPTRLPAFIPSGVQSTAGMQNVVDTQHHPVERPDNLQFDNGLGGFSPDGKEYVIYLKDGEHTPLPWSNVIGYPEFGFIVTESGSSTTWSLNSGENRLTPWSNDPVGDPSGEVIYLRDEETAELWSPTPLPCPSKEPYRIHHGAGYTEFYHNSHGLKQRLKMFASPDEPVKVVQLRIENLLDRPRRITATYYVEWILGTKRSDTQPYIIPEYDDETQALLAVNRYNPEFGERVAFAAASKPLHGLTADRTEFLGRNGSYTRPAALGRIGLAGEVSPGIDPCAALQVHLDLPPGGSEEFSFLLGQGKDRTEALRLVTRYKNPQVITSTWESVHAFWDKLLGGVVVDTPDSAMNLLLNRWLLYQALSCRIWGRSAFYQSSGAYGFRDQLQDVLSLLLSRPEETRAQILRAAAHQFDAGDVLHWWHPPYGRGVRTRISDDLIWLPFVTAEYIEKTDDLSILNELIPFRIGAPLEPGEDERYGQYSSSSEGYSLLEHCHRALQHGLTSGPHGLPLIGTGDWNDGLNRVGAEGKGESVWLGWFLDVTLRRFASVCDQVGQIARAEQYRQQAARLVQAIEESAWDGEWYRRAYYDDGSPLGSKQNIECQIDSIAQSWAVFSGRGDPQRSRQAIHSAKERLVREEEGLILLFTPPFDRTVRNPGYIRGYVPGIRENGGQYTHAALWLVLAAAQSETGDEVWRLFNLINPIQHALDPQNTQRYKVEPYVVAADIYGVEPHLGRGGWTWYTGSSGWMYTLGIEAILGLQKEGNTLRIKPCVPQHWKTYQIHYRFGESVYHIQVHNAGESSRVSKLSLDGEDRPDQTVPLSNKRGEHYVIVHVGQDNSS